MPADAAWSRPAGEELSCSVPHIADFQKFVLIVGAPRSGTTSMSRLLQAHPQVAFPFVKEPHFFAQHDLRGLPDDELRQRVETDYLDHFFGPPKPGQIAGADGSVSYLYAPEQLEPVVRLWPDARFIVGVRDPLTLLPSLHQRLIYTGDETITRFEDAWDAVADRAAGRRIPRSCIEPRWLRYDEAARYATYIERLFAAVGRERCQVIVYDDLAADAAAEHRRILDFAGLQPIPPIAGHARRAGRAVRLPWLQRLLKRPPKVLHPYLAGRQFSRRFEEQGKSGGSSKQKVSLRKRLLRWNRIEARPLPMPPRVQQEIRDHFQGEIDRLGVLIGRDLGHWLQVRS